MEDGHRHGERTGERRDQESKRPKCFLHLRQTRNPTCSIEYASSPDEVRIPSNLRRNSATPKKRHVAGVLPSHVARRHKRMLTLDLAPIEPLRCDPKPTNAFEPIHSGFLSRSGPQPVERSAERVGKATWAPPPICGKTKERVVTNGGCRC